MDYTEEDINGMFTEQPDGRAVALIDCPELKLEQGKIYATKGNAVYWAKKRAGLVSHTSRGKDISVRPLPASKTLATRYYENTGRNIIKEMEDERQLVQMMFDTASNIEDPHQRFLALDKCTAAQSRFNKTWTPYLEQKLGTLQSTSTIEDKISLDDILNGDS